MTTDVLTYHNDTLRTGQNLTETTLTPTNVKSSSFGLLRVLNTDNPVDATPLIASKVSIAGALHNVVYVATENDTVYAYDADSGALLLHISLLGSGEVASDTRSCGATAPGIGVTATPVIDRSIGPNGTLYVVAMSKDSSSNYYQRLHALDLTTLADRMPAVAIQATAAGGGANTSNGVQTFSPAQYLARGALLAGHDWDSGRGHPRARVGLADLEPALSRRANGRRHRNGNRPGDQRGVSRRSLDRT